MGVSRYILSLFFVFTSGLDIIDVDLAQREKECYGTHSRFSISGSQEYHYNSLKERFQGCTHVIGNLEITNLSNHSNDLSFLSSIKVVTGYVLIGLLPTEIIPLTSLQLIRGDTTLEILNKRFGLFVVYTSKKNPHPDDPKPGLRELQLPRLKEISQGNVGFHENTNLCFVDTIDWSKIIGNGTLDLMKAPFSQTCNKCECHEDCADSLGIRRCWGAGKHMCQKVGPDCHRACRSKRCFKEGMLGCCHPTCAAGCTGPLNTQCEMCKYFRYGHKCRYECPENTYPLAQECIDF